MAFFNGHMRSLQRGLLLIVMTGATVHPSPQAQPPVISQDAALTRSIQGKVLSKEGAPVSEAIILLKNMKTLQVRSYIAQNDGTYHFFGLSSDVSYQVRAENNGMTSKTKNISVFDSHRIITVNLKLIKRLKT